MLEVIHIDVYPTGQGKNIYCDILLMHGPDLASSTL